MGSTSVPGLGGRRTLDAVVVAEAGDHDRSRSALLEIGFADFPWAHVKPMLKGSVVYGNREYACCSTS